MDQPPQNTGEPQFVRPQVIREVAPAPRRQSGCLGRFFLLMLIFALGGSLLLNMILGAGSLAGLSGFDAEARVREKFLSHERMAENKVAVLSIEGTIMSGEGFFKNQIDHALRDAKDGRLKAVVVRVNSPGGTITGSDYMLHHLNEFAKKTDVPIVVSMGGIAASGGYYVSMCVGDRPDTIFAEPTTWTGSIGVIIPHYNIAELMKNWGIEEDNVASGPLKGMGSFARKMTEKERQIFQGLVTAGFDRFKEVIKQGRPKFMKDPAALDKLATGQVYTADQALHSGLVDKIGFLEDAVDRAIELAKLDKDNVKVVQYKNEPRFADIFFGSDARTRRTELATLLDMATPKAYYLCTWLPPLAGTEQ